MTPLFSALLMLAVGLDGQDASSRHPTIEPMEPDFLAFWFSSVQIDRGILLMKRGKEDLSFMFQKETDPPAASPPGGVLQLPVGLSGRLFNHQSMLKFIPFPDHSGRDLFLLEETNRIGDKYVGLLRLIAKGTGPHALAVFPVSVDTQEGLALVEAQVKAGTFTDPAK